MESVGGYAYFVSEGTLSADPNKGDKTKCDKLSYSA